MGFDFNFKPCTKFFALTCWEAERGILLQAEISRRMESQNAIENAPSNFDFSIGAALIIAGIAAMAAIIDEPQEAGVQWRF